MKKILLSLFVICAIVSCGKIFTNNNEEEEFWIVDWAPVSLIFYVHDSDGTDLLDPDYPDNIIAGTTITFREKTYSASKLWYDSQTMYIESETSGTKAILAIMYGLYLVDKEMLGDTSGNDFALWFGEIDGAEDMDENIVIRWPDGTSNTVRYHCSDHYEGENPTCNRSFLLDGETNIGNRFYIVK